MNYKFGKIVVIAFGGSIINPGKVNSGFLKSFRGFVLKWTKRGKKFVIVAGGGSVARNYQKAGSKVLKLSNEDKDWIGIHATRLNAHLLRTIFWKEADPMVIDKRFKIQHLKYKVTIGSGWRPGWSTDFDAVQLAADFGAKEVVIAGSPAYVYSSDPQKNKNARAIKNLSWKEYRKLIPAHWAPGSHSPVDPVAAKLADTKKLSAIIINGINLKNFDNLLAGKDFRGTIIH